MAVTAVALLSIFVLNVWLSLTALQAIATGIVRMSGRSYRRELEHHEFWFAVAAKVATAIIFFLYLASIVGQMSHKPQEDVSASARSTRSAYALSGAKR